MKNKWTNEDISFLREHYPQKGKRWCADALNKSEMTIRCMTSYYKIYQDRNSEFFKDWQKRAGESKVGKKRPEQANVIRKIRAEGKLKKTQAMKDATSIQVKEYWRINGHPKGMLGKKHSDKSKAEMAIKSKITWEALTDEEKVMRTKKIMRTRVLKGNYAHHRICTTWKAAWREIGGKRKYFRSKWEANYARYLEFLKLRGEIKDWLHESEVFWFEGVRRGCVSYLPDFKVINNNDSIEYHEVKGWMDDRSKTKIRRMAKYYPEIKLLVIRQKQYTEISNKLGKVIFGWE